MRDKDPVDTQNECAAPDHGPTVGVSLHLHIGGFEQATGAAIGVVTYRAEVIS